MPAAFTIPDRLADRIVRLEGRNPAFNHPRSPTGWPPIDATLPLGGLAAGALHEWCSGGMEAAHPRRDRQRERRRWTPPLSVAAHLVGAMVSSHASSVCWIGRRVWPSRGAFSAAVLDRSVFIDASRVSERLWASETLLRSGASIVVVLDGSGMDLTMTRRLQLAAGSGADGLALSLRPAQELSTPSAAATRWRVTPQVTHSTHPRWSVELMRCKGPQPTTGAPRRWTVEQKSDGTGLVCIPDELADGPGEAADAVGGQADPAVVPRWSA